MKRFWQDSLLDAIMRVVANRGDSIFTRQELIKKELEKIIEETNTIGKTPDQTLSFELQELRDSGFVEFLGKGQYKLSRKIVDIDAFEGTDEEIDDVIKKGNLLIRNIPTEDKLVIAKRRKGQSRLRLMALGNYNNKCAVCDIENKDLLVASHIIGWAESEISRGDLTNVLILCRPHDALFELGFWSLRDNFNVLVKPSNNNPWVIDAILPPKILFSQPKVYLPGLTYLKRHREKHGFFNS